MRSSFTFLISLVVTLSFAQDSILLTPGKFMQIVIQNHPEAKRAYLAIEASQANLTASRGAFDPTIFAQYQNKQFEGKNYFSHMNAGLEMPTITGIKLKSGYDLNEGILLNPELTVPNNGLWYVGAEVPIGQGLFTDPKRMKLNQSKVKVSMAETFNAIRLNELSLEALEKYWVWQEEYQKLRIFQEAFDFATQRVLFVIQSVENGESAPIDTVEARIQQQVIFSDLVAQRARYQSAIFELINFIWGDEQPSTPEAFDFAPDTSYTFDEFQLNSLLNALNNQHPLLRANLLKQEILDTERRWYAEQLKPVLNLEYSVLGGWEGQLGESLNTTDFNNHKVGLNFSFPLLLRQSRGNLEEVKIEMESTSLMYDQKENEIRNKIRALHNELEQIDEQIELYQRLVRNYRILLEGEQEKFRNGESSLFLVNSRQQKLIEVQIKRIAWIRKRGQKEAWLLWATGRLHERFL